MNEDFKKKAIQQWIVFVGVFFMCFSAMGLGSNAFGLWTVPVTEALGMARAQYSLFETVSKIVGMVTSLCFAGIYRKLGAKGAVAIAGAGYVIQYICIGLAKSLPLILVGGFFCGIGYTFAAQLTVFAIIPPWFKKTKGTMTSILSATNTLGTTVWTYFVTKWMAAQDFRYASFICAAIIFVMCTISFLLVKSSPDDPLRQAANEEKKQKDQNALTNRQLLKIPHEWILIAIYFIVAGTAHPITANIPAFADAKGFAAATGAAAYALCYAVMTPAKIGVGLIKDKWGAKVAVPVVFFFYIMAILWVILPVPEKMYSAIGVFHGIGGTMSQLLIAYIVMDSFGKFYHPGAMGICLALFNVGRAIGMPAIHIGYDKTGSYTATMYIWLALAILTLFLAMLCLRMGKKWQVKHEQELIAASKDVPETAQA